MKVDEIFNLPQKNLNAGLLIWLQNEVLFLLAVYYHCLRCSVSPDSSSRWVTQSPCKWYNYRNYMKKDMVLLKVKQILCHQWTVSCHSRKKKRAGKMQDIDGILIGIMAQYQFRTVNAVGQLNVLLFYYEYVIPEDPCRKCQIASDDKVNSCWNDCWALCDKACPKQGMFYLFCRFSTLLCAFLLFLYCFPTLGNVLQFEGRSHHILVLFQERMT